MAPVASGLALGRLAIRPGAWRLRTDEAALIDGLHRWHDGGRCLAACPGCAEFGLGRGRGLVPLRPAALPRLVEALRGRAAEVAQHVLRRLQQALQVRGNRRLILLPSDRAAPPRDRVPCRCCQQPSSEMSRAFLASPRMPPVRSGHSATILFLLRLVVVAGARARSIADLALGRAFSLFSRRVVGRPLPAARASDGRRSGSVVIGPADGIMRAVGDPLGVQPPAAAS